MRDEVGMMQQMGIIPEPGQRGDPDPTEPLFTQVLEVWNSRNYA
jgi:hypothetical protein